MPSRQRDPHDLFDFWDEDAPTHQPSAPGRAKPFPKRSTIFRLPAFDPAEETFHTRATPPRMPALHQTAFDEEEDAQLAIAEADFAFIAGPSKPRAPHAERRKTSLAIKRLARLAILPLVFVMLLGVQGFIVSLSGDCSGAQARQHQQHCFALNLFTAFSDTAVNPPAATSPTAAPPKLPAIPTDLPNNVRSFMKVALPFAVQAHQALNWPTSTILAQWGLEHGWSVPDAQGYNWGNTTYAPNCPYRGSRFCYASTPAEGLREFIYTARLNYYRNIAPAARQGGADAAAQELGKSPWDFAHYAGKGQPGSLLLAIMHNFNLYRFDSEL